MDLFSYLLGKKSGGTPIPPTSDLILPSDYTAVNYLQSSGTQYIDTSYVANANTKIEIKCSQDRTAGGVVFGSRETASPTDLAYALGTNSGKICFYYNALVGYDTTITTGSFIDIKVESSKVNCNLTQSATINITQFPTGSLYLFAINRGEGQTITDYSTSKIGEFIIFDNNKLVHYFIPCKRNSDDELGMYDLVDQVFKTNDGTGSFTYS